MTTLKRIEFTIPGKPVPLGRPRARQMSKFVLIHECSKSAKAKKRFAAIARTYAPGKPIEVPLEVTLTFRFKRPKSHFGTGRNADKLKPSAPIFHAQTPDVDNLAKLVLDAMNKMFYADDSQVVLLSAIKCYGKFHETKVEISPITKTAESTE